MTFLDINYVTRLNVPRMFPVRKKHSTNIRRTLTMFNEHPQNNKYKFHIMIQCIIYHLINHLCYADDLCLISLYSAGMHSLLDICNSYAIEHVLTYNSNTSYSLYFKPKHIKFARPCFYLNRLEIPRVDQCKYLGIMICTKNCDIDLKRQMRNFYANINILSRKFAKCSSDVKCTLFKSFCSNMYCSTMWYNMELLLL